MKMNEEIRNGRYEDVYGNIMYYNDGVLHKENAPAMQWLNGKRHKEDGPAVELANGTKQWFINGQYHRENGPAIEFPDGKKEWYLFNRRVTEEEFQQYVSNEELEDSSTRKKLKNGKYVSDHIGVSSWYKNGLLHREDGPAIITRHGDEYWFLNGVAVTEDEFKNKQKITVDDECLITDADINKHVKAVCSQKRKWGKFL